MMDSTRRSFDLEAIRADFPILSREVHGKPLVYLDTVSYTHLTLPTIDPV